MQDIPSEWIGKDVMFPVQGSQLWAGGTLKDVTSNEVVIRYTPVREIRISYDSEQTWDVESRKVFPEQEDRYSRTEIGTVQLR